MGYSIDTIKQEENNMKYICKQMNPAYQESPLFRDRDMWDDVYDRLYLVPADRCIG